MKILLIAAMYTEIDDIISKLGMTFQGKLANFFPFYKTVLKDSKEVFLVQTHVGSINAPTAAALALQVIKPAFAIKVGCVGGNSPGIKKNDIVVPVSFFHSGAWITRSYIDRTPTSNASQWESLYGDEPYQNNKSNLGGIEYIFTPDKKLTQTYRLLLEKEGLQYKEAHLGSGDIVIFDHKFMDNIRENILYSSDKKLKLCTDNESHAIAQVCQIFHVPFTGVYFVASSDYEDVGGYDQDSIRKQNQKTIVPIIEKLINQIQ